MNEALKALVEAKVDAVFKDWQAKYGPALDEWIYSGRFSPSLMEIGYNGTEIAPANRGLSDWMERNP